MDAINARRLVLNDLPLLKSLRLEALSEDPDAFGSTYEREVDRTDDEWQRWFTLGAVFVASQGSDDAVGLAAGFRDVGGEDVAHLVSMWVRPAHRGTGAADALVAAVLDWAQSEGLPVVQLNVLGGNVRATKLYTRHGFYPTGTTSIRDRDGAVEIEMQRD
jgi:ribosomal protein S18 acetylase RimI-like enzyme